MLFEKKKDIEWTIIDNEIYKTWGNVMDIQLNCENPHSEKTTISAAQFNMEFYES